MEQKAKKFQRFRKTGTVFCEDETFFWGGGLVCIQKHPLGWSETGDCFQKYVRIFRLLKMKDFDVYEMMHMTFVKDQHQQVNFLKTIFCL